MARIAGSVFFDIAFKGNYLIHLKTVCNTIRDDDYSLLPSSDI